MRDKRFTVVRIIRTSLPVVVSTGRLRNRKKKAAETRRISPERMSGNHSTLVISDVTDTTFSYTLTSLNPEDAQQVATISIIA